MGRKSLLKSTKTKSSGSPTDAGSQEVKRKKAILEGVRDFPGSIKNALEKLGLSQSTYYRWVQKYKEQGAEGLNMGTPVSEKVWKRFRELKAAHDQPLQTEHENKAEEKQAMKSEKDSDKTRELLFKKFDDGTKGAAPKKAAAAAEEKKADDAACDSGATAFLGEPVDKTMKYALGGFAVVLAILLMSSFSNTTNFYFKQDGEKVDLWQGRFAPMGERKVAGFSDPQMLSALPQQESYSKRQAYSVVFDHLVGQADDILNTSRTPDLKTVQATLMEAFKYAVDSKARKAVQLRLDSISFLVLSGKADLALSKGTMADFEAAKAHLTEAIPYATTDIQKELITKRLAAIEYAMASSKISKGEKQLAQLYREALDRHLKKAKEFSPEKSTEIDAEMEKIRGWLNEFDKRHVSTGR